MNENFSGFRVRAVSAPWRKGVEFLVRDYRAIGTLVMEEAKTGAQMRPTFSLNMENAQTLMDDLWQTGLRPTEGTGSAGALRAVEKHLNDMRKITSKKLGVEL